ncbi:Rho-type GTPase-activating protein 1 [Wickerhamiella sorbophila]|uniref:Rho-type GTPase-activating protein 1 n=1 Tax=Wickerhamiella sorbophila TaxID=45607 RepID=A0A2T0FBX3_9ASCO|nr:Rho-type GTPase-activating protein 1 [Wickerhamiella sorbophila]PRT52439.1 Rho-type GTPase-activating protein 1 [Wickerhamiella sorbophila]
MESCSAPEALSKSGFDFLDATSGASDSKGRASVHSKPYDRELFASPINIIASDHTHSGHNRANSQVIASPRAITASPRKSTTGYSMSSPRFSAPTSPGPIAASPHTGLSPPQLPRNENIFLTPLQGSQFVDCPVPNEGNFGGPISNGHANRGSAPGAPQFRASPVGSPSQPPMRSPDRKESRSNWYTPTTPRSGPKGGANNSNSLPLAPPNFDAERLSNAASPIGGQQPAGHKKNCAKCGGPISGQFVRALGTAFHLDCFTCGDCGEHCAAKFFPLDIEPISVDKPLQIPLCERCYFKRLDLLCYRCGDALRGSYITALDRKYHVEHFTCSLCSTIFGPEDSYYEHDNDVYCHYHYSTLHAARCEGCRAAILKQFVETYRGGREQQWHPECYMIFKFWNVKLAGTGIMQGCDEKMSGKSGDVPSNTRLEIASRERDIDKLVTLIWSTLCGYEELSAGHVSNMVQFAVQKSCRSALEATKQLVERVQILFDALDTLPPEPREDKRLSKEPKTLCRKIVSYMSTLSKIRQERSDAMSDDLLNVATSIAHYLKVLIRFGLAASLAHNREDTSRPVLEMFLSAMAVKQPKVKYPVTALTSDRCAHCDNSVEDGCLRYSDKLWHFECLKCSICDRELANSLDEAKYTPADTVVCTTCKPDQTQPAEFSRVSRLGQYMFLLNIALARLELVLGQYDARDTSQTASLSTPVLPQPGSSSLSSALIHPRSSSGEDVTTLKNVIDKASAESSHSRSTKPAGKQPGSNQERVPALERTSRLLQSKVSLTLDDIRRIVAAEQAREQMPNSYRHRTGAEMTANEWLRTPQDRKNAQSETAYFGNLSLDDYTLVQHIAAVRLLVEYPNIQFGELAELIGRKNSSFWSKMGKAFGASKKKSSSGVFGAPLEALLERNGADSTLGVGDYKLRIPSFVDDCVTAMRQKDMSVEGVFRKNGNIRRIREFVEAVDKNPDFTSTLADEQPIQLAALLKKFLRELPEPLMGSKLTKLWVQVNSLEQERQVPFLRLVVCLLNKSQRDLLEVLMYFLNWAASFAHLDEEAGSKMDAQNMATVITPNIMLAKDEDGSDIHFQAIAAVSILIEQHMIVAEIPPEVDRLLAQVKEKRKDKMSTRELTELIREVAGGDQLHSALETPKSSSATRSTDI